jgi:hypothetical protein
MPFADKPSRSLLPPIEAEAREILGSPAVIAGSPVLTSGVARLDSPAAAHSHFDVPPQSHDSAEGYDLHGGAPPQAIDAVMQSNGQAPTMDLLAEREDGPHFTSLSVAWHMKPPKLPNVHHQGGEERGARDQRVPERPDPDSKVPADTDSHRDSDIHDEPDQRDGGLSVEVTQTAIVEQDASIIVTGYVGEVVARLHVGQNVVMDQDADISLTLDGDGNFSVAVGQDTHIDQKIDVDLDVFDVDGVLHVDLFLRDSITVDQETTIDMDVGDGEPGGTVDVDQDVVLNQDVHVDIDIEDELQERYAVTIKVDAVQTADIDQYAGVNILDRDGHIGMDVDAVQTAMVEQETVVRADFSLA